MARGRSEPRFNPGPSAVEALARRYTKWAKGRGLAEEKYRFVGRIDARDVIFATGLGGSYPSPPEIVVLVKLDLPTPVLLKSTIPPASTRGRSSDATPRAATLLREVLDASDDIRNLGLTQSFVRITFEPGTEETALDEALAALEERLRLLAGEGTVPYRG